MTRRASAPATVRCRICRSTAHSTADCPPVRAAFGPDQSAQYEHPCTVCGRLVRTRSKSSRVYCDECRQPATRAGERERYTRSIGGMESVRRQIAVRIVRCSAESGYIPGAYLNGWQYALEAGYLEPGMLVTYNGVLKRVIGAPLAPQKLAPAPREWARHSK